jgi:hypothetical protein
MQFRRVVRTFVSFLVLGLVAVPLGCSGEGGSHSVPPDKETSKKIAAETKAAQLERMKAMRSQTAKGVR